MIGSKATFECTRNIPENMYTLASRIEDADHGADWLDSCAKSFTVRDVSNPAGVPNRVQFDAYERLKGRAILGIDDRDIYLHGAWRKAGNALVCDLSPSVHPPQGPLPGVVRMPDLQGRFRLQPTATHATSVTYALNVDLGGSVPDFIKDLAVKEIPRKSLDNLAREASRGPGIYEQAGQELLQALDATQAA